MKKILFIALLSLVTFGAKAYDVIFVNNTFTSFTFQWGLQPNITITPSGNFLQNINDQDPNVRASTGPFCSNPASNGTQIIGTGPWGFTLNYCGIAAAWYTFDISRDPNGNYLVEIN